MKNQNIVSQIFIGVAIPVLSAFLIWKLGINNKSNPQSTNTTTVMVDPNSPSKEVPRPQKKEYIHVTVSDALGIDQYGYGQIEESVTINIDGNIKTINLTALGKTSGVVRFKLPEEGFYDYEVNSTTIFNNHHYQGQQCTHYGYGRGNIHLGNNEIFQMAIDPQTLDNQSYTAYLEKM